MDIVLDTCPVPECNLTPRDVAGLLDQLATYHAHFVPAFARSEQACWAETYLRGLLSSCERKSIEPMALHLGMPIRPLQHFIGQSTWSIEPVVAQHQTQALERLAAFRTRWGQLESEVVRLLGKDIELSLTFYQFDVSLHPLVRSTNLLERFFREFRTKADEIGSFPNELTCLTLFHLIVVRDHAKHDRGKVAQTG